jgi:hypothetical protein
MKKEIMISPGLMKTSGKQPVKSDLFIHPMFKVRLKEFEKKVDEPAYKGDESA